MFLLKFSQKKTISTSDILRRADRYCEKNRCADVGISDLNVCSNRPTFKRPLRNDFRTDTRWPYSTHSTHNIYIYIMVRVIVVLYIYSYSI